MSFSQLAATLTSVLSLRNTPAWSRPLLAAGALGLSVLSAGVAAAPVPQADAPSLHLLDEFPADSSTVTHGTLVESALKDRTSMAIVRHQVSLDAGLNELEKGLPGSLNGYVVRRFVTPTQQTARALEQIHGPAVAGQSQGASESRVVEGLWGAVLSRQTIRQTVERELGLPSDASDAALASALVQRVDQVHDQDPQIASARGELLQAAEKAADRGVIRVISAGNQGELGKQLQSLGATLPTDFYRSDVADPNAIIVGASDNHRTATLSDDGAASIASPDAGALIATQGVDVPVRMHGKIWPQTGSSFAQPQVTGAISDWLTADPGLTRNEALARLQSLARPVPGAERQVGAGIVSFHPELLARR